MQRFVLMKKEANDNKLCLTCRRACKQPSAVIIAKCPRYYAGPKLKRRIWKQLKFSF
jgi:hypothetical protein